MHCWHKAQLLLSLIFSHKYQVMNEVLIGVYIHSYNLTLKIRTDNFTRCSNTRHLNIENFILIDMKESNWVVLQKYYNQGNRLYHIALHIIFKQTQVITASGISFKLHMCFKHSVFKRVYLFCACIIFLDPISRYLHDNSFDGIRKKRFKMGYSKKNMRTLLDS